MLIKIFLKSILIYHFYKISFTNKKKVCYDTFKMDLIENPKVVTQLRIPKQKEEGNHNASYYIIKKNKEKEKSCTSIRLIKLKICSYY